MEAAILEGLPDAVVAIARDERIVFVNALAEELFGYPRDELLGRPLVDQLLQELDAIGARLIRRIPPVPRSRLLEVGQVVVEGRQT